jgi:pimeloyl-ACP methyl ester carboxylesterase
LRDVTLVGHSYAANVISGAADRAPERIGRLIYLDTWPLPDGAMQADLMWSSNKEEQLRQVATQGEGWRLPLPAWADLDQGNDLRDLGEAERRHLRERATDHPVGTFTQPVRLTNPARDQLPKTAIWCSQTAAEVQQMIIAYPQVCSELAKPGWQVLELPTGHWPMFSKPSELAAMLGSVS